MTVIRISHDSRKIPVSPPTKQVSAGETIVSSQRKHAVWPVAMNTYKDAKLREGERC